MTAGMVIAGAGECGARAAFALREHGYAGPITLVGAEPHTPYERPPLSKEVMIADAAVPPKTIATAERLAESGIAFRPSQGIVALDRGAQVATLSDHTRLPYDRLLIATGAHPRHLARDGHSGRHFLTLRTYDDALRIRSRIAPGRKVVVIGGGVIGLEVAAAAATRGANVTVVEFQNRLLSRNVPAPIAAVITERHEAAGVEIALSVSVERVAEHGEHAHLLLSDGRKLEADVVIVGIGVQPETALAEAAGLDVENGVVVNDRLATSDPNVFAAGDCCFFPHPLFGGRWLRLESWRSAQEQGALAARNMLGADEAISAVPWFWSDQYDLTLQVAGLPDEGVSVVERSGDGTLVLFHLADDGRLVGAAGVGPGNAVARDIRIAEMLIAKSAHPDAAALARADVKLKSLLAA